jgi:hypothetical protein
MSDELVQEPRDGTKLSANHMGSGSPLVLVHGSIVTHETWALVAPLLAIRTTCGATTGGPTATVATVPTARSNAKWKTCRRSRPRWDRGFTWWAIPTARWSGSRRRPTHPGLRSLVLYEPPVHPDQKQDAVGRGREPLDAGDREAFLDLFLIELAGAPATRSPCCDLPVSVIPVGPRPTG